MMKKLSALALVAVCIGLSACSTLGTSRFRADQVDYARALGDAKKREILAEIVGIRYADAPGYLTASQIISGYSFSAGSSAFANLGENNTSFARGQIAGTLAYANTPTFTFTPTTGEAFATAFIQPLPATIILPLADSGTPIDLLLRLTIQSIAGLQNASALGGPNGNGTPGFFELISALRRLQVAGELTVQFDKASGQVSMTISATSSGESGSTEADLQRVRQLLQLSDKTKTYQIVYGQTAQGGDRIPMVTRSVLGILGDLGAQVQVPDADIASGATTPTVGLVGGETRPTVLIRSGPHPAKTSYVAIKYNDTDFWIDNNDFDSKYAISTLQTLMALAQANQSVATPVVTVPAH